MARKHVFPALMALAALTACDGGSPTGGADAAATLTQAEAQELAYAWDGVGAGVMDGQGGPFTAVLPGSPAAATNSIAFNSTRACPSGGSATVQGTREVTRGDGSGSVAVSATRTDAACAFPARRGAEGTVMTITTTPSVQLTSQQTWTNGQPGTRTSTQKGSFDWSRSGGASGSCTVDLTATWTPATRTYTLQGTFCDRAIDVTRTRPE